VVFDEGGRACSRGTILVRSYAPRPLDLFASPYSSRINVGAMPLMASTGMSATVCLLLIASA